MYNPGKLRTRVTIQTRTVTVTAGVPEETWADSFLLWAEAEEIRGSRSMQMDGYTAVARARFWVRDSAQAQGIRPESHRVKWDGRVWGIESNAALTIERGLREIFCQEQVGE